MILSLLFLTSASAVSFDCPNPGLALCNLNLFLEDRTGPVCDIVDFEGCEEKFSDLTAESWADLYATFECYCEQPEIQQFLKTAALPAVIVFDQISNEYQHDYSIASRRNLGWGWEEWLNFGIQTAIGVGGVALTIWGRRELATTQLVTFDFNEVFHTCNAIDVPTSFCSQLMSDNAFEFSQVCGGDLTCNHDIDSVMEILETAKSTTLAELEPHTECPDLGLAFCLMHNIFGGKFGPICDNLGEAVIDNCESQFAGINAEDFNTMYDANNMDCFCGREEVQVELNKARTDVILFDLIMATSHVALPARRALWWDDGDWLDFMSVSVSTTLAVLGAFLPLVGRRNMDSAAMAHFDWTNIVEVCSQYTAFDMCEMPAELNVKEFEFLCLGEAECEVSVKDLQKLLKHNHIKQMIDGF